MIFYKNTYKKGVILATVLVFTSIAILITSALVSWAGTNTKSSRAFIYQEQALQIAEAGVNYYRWHLAHAPQDYTDGTTTPGPYIHAYNDKDGNRIGQYALTITPPPLGSTLVTVQSKGQVDAYPSVTRTVKAQFAKPSIAKYAIVANDNMRFGAGTVIYGPIQANGGIHFDGLAYNTVSSAKSSYVDPDYGGPEEFGVYTRVFPADPYPPEAVPSRPDVFVVGRQFPVAAVDFVGMTTDLSSMKSQAQASGKYLVPSGAQGYHLVFKVDATTGTTTVDVYKVTKLLSLPNGCTSSWSIKATGGQTFIANYHLPGNGIIFVEDNAWVDGTVNNARVTVVSAKFPIPTTPPSITINDNFMYTNYNGQDSVALIAQGDMNVGYSSADTLRIDAAIIAQNGRVGRYYYANTCGSNYKRSNLTLYGMIATNLRYGFAYVDGTGYQTRTIVYDTNMLYAPPPAFPLTTDQYTVISWQEVK